MQIAIRQAPGDGGSACLQWRSGAGTVEAFATLTCEAEHVSVAYRWRDGDRWRSCRQVIGLKYDQPPLGGRRRFWRCPLCGGGARKVYAGDDGAFACKRCLRLAHRSQRQPTWQRALARAGKLRRYCGGGGGAADPFPARPRGMRRRTYEALRDEAERLERLPPEAWLSAGENRQLDVRRSTMGASKRRWWPARHAKSREERHPGQGG